MEDLDLLFKRKLGNKSNLNFDLGALTNNFNFYDFCETCIHSKQNGEYGAFLVISDKQCVLGYNQGFGSGAHYESFARFNADAFFDEKRITSYSEILPLATFITDNYITARIVYEKSCNDLKSHVISYYGYINFNLINNKFSLNQLELFKKFYDRFNSELILLNQKCGLKIYVYFSKNGIVCCKELNNLDFILEYISNNISITDVDSDEKVVNYSLFSIHDLKHVLNIKN